MGDIIEYGMPEKEPVFSAHETHEQEVVDLISLAFADNEFEPIPADMVSGLIRSGSTRSKTTYDPAEGCGVLAIEYMGLADEGDGKLQSGHLLVMQWDNGKERFFDMNETRQFPVKEDKVLFGEEAREATNDIGRVLGLFIDEAI